MSSQATSQELYADELVLRLFKAQEARPESLADLDFAALSPFQRSLLVMVGLVTQFIEAYRLEPVKVLMLSQEPEKLAEADRWLDAEPGAPLVHRRVLLRGEDSGEPFVYGEAWILPERLPEFVQRGIEREEKGLGRLLIDGRVEFHGELMWCGVEKLDEGLPESLAYLSRRPLISRTYRFVSNELPLMRITERFPMEEAPTGGPERRDEVGTRSERRSRTEGRSRTEECS